MFERATIDFEGRSACNLKRAGAWLYSKHPTTQLHCLGYHLPGQTKVKLWHRAYPALGIKESPPPDDLFEWIEEGKPVEAHNAPFELYCWNHIGVPKHKWPKLRLRQLHCSAAKAAAHALPRGLDGACAALNLPIRKDPRGDYLINKYCKPRKPVKIDFALSCGEPPIEFNEDIDGLCELFAYNGQDVRAEKRLSESLADLSPMEREVWLITQEMNIRGVLIDTELARQALKLAQRVKEKANDELYALTGVASASQRKALTEWLRDSEHFLLPDSKAKTLEHILEHDFDLSPRAARVLEIIKDVNRTSTQKFGRMLECVSPDQRARELMVYCGAERTGRFSSSKIQIHNLPKGKFTAPLSKADRKRAMDIACEDVKSGNLEWCEAIHGDVMNLIASCLRGAIIAPPGHELLTADYAAIEARCVLWESGAVAALEVFRLGGDIYCDMASGIYGYQIVKDDIALLKANNPQARIAAVINSMGATQRDFGKVAVLGLGYGMGYITFLLTLRTYNIRLTRDEVLAMMGAKRLAKYEAIVRRKLFPKLEDFLDRDEPEKAFRAASRDAALNRRRLTDAYERPEKILHELALCKLTVETYRTRYPQVPKMWKAQEAAAIKAVQSNKPVKCGPVTWFVKGRFLKCRLPSGRCLNYCDPHLAKVKTSWGDVRASLRFWGICQVTKRWIRQATYGGKIVENITQAIARDIMAHAKIAIKKNRAYALLLSVHDEIITQVAKGCGNEREFETVMSALPAVYAGCPITAEAKRYARYRK